MSNKYCDQHWAPIVKISKKPVIIEDTKAGNCDFHNCPKPAVYKLRFYKNPPPAQGAAIV